jgi:cytoskeletal protein RodZ
MKLFRRNQQTDIPADLEPYVARDWRLWVRRLVGIIALLALCALIVWAGVKVFRSVTEDEPATTTQKADDQSDKQQKATDSTKKTDSKSQTTQTTPKATTSQPTTMPKTGDDVMTQPATLPSTGG